MQLAAGATAAAAAAAAAAVPVGVVSDKELRAINSVVREVRCFHRPADMTRPPQHSGYTPNSQATLEHFEHDGTGTPLYTEHKDASSALSWSS
jgi:hypothetical protein